jgi:hypothetical protein
MTMWAQTAGKASTEANADQAAFDAALPPMLMPIELNGAMPELPKVEGMDKFKKWNLPGGVQSSFDDVAKPKMDANRWDRAVDAVCDAIKAIADEIDKALEAVGKLIGDILDAVKNAACALIDAARDFVCAALSEFGDWLVSHPRAA